MNLVERYKSDLLQKIKIPWLMRNDHKDHISLIYKNHIVEIYQFFIKIIYILEDNTDEEIIKPSDIEYINAIL